MLAATATARVWKRQREIPIFEKAEIYEGETHFSEKGREVSQKERENREQRNKKLGKMFYIKL